MPSQANSLIRPHAVALANFEIVTTKLDLPQPTSPLQSPWHGGLSFQLISEIFKSDILLHVLLQRHLPCLENHFSIYLDFFSSQSVVLQHDVLLGHLRSCFAIKPVHADPWESFLHPVAFTCFTRCCCSSFYYTCGLLQQDSLF